MNEVKQYEERLRIGVLLALTGGFLDSYTYLCRGGVFANAQTGNMALLGVNFLNGNTEKVIKYLLPILTFAIGVVITEVIKEWFVKNDNIHWGQAVLVVEILILILVAFTSNDYIANVLVSLVCAIQVDAFRKFHGNVYATTMCTGNLRSGTEKIILYIKQKDRKHLKVAIQYYFIIVIFCIGAAIGGLSVDTMGKRAVLVSVLPLVLALIIIGYYNKNILAKK